MTNGLLFIVRVEISVKNTGFNRFQLLLINYLFIFSYIRWRCINTYYFYSNRSTIFIKTQQTIINKHQTVRGK